MTVSGTGGKLGLKLLRALASSLLSVLIAGTLLWGGCVSCEQYFMLGKQHGCCDHEGRCKTKSPAKSKSGAACNQIAFDHQRSIDLQIDLPVTAVKTIEVPPPQVAILPQSEARLADPSPPDLYLLHAVFLI